MPWQLCLPSTWQPCSCPIPSRQGCMDRRDGTVSDTARAFHPEFEENSWLSAAGVALRQTLPRNPMGCCTANSIQPICTGPAYSLQRDGACSRLRFPEGVCRTVLVTSEPKSPTNRDLQFLAHPSLSKPLNTLNCAKQIMRLIPCPSPEDRRDTPRSAGIALASACWSSHHSPAPGDCPMAPPPPAWPTPRTHHIPTGV